MFYSYLTFFTALSEHHAQLCRFCVLQSARQNYIGLINAFSLDPINNEPEVYLKLIYSVYIDHQHNMIHWELSTYFQNTLSGSANVVLSSLCKDNGFVMLSVKLDNFIDLFNRISLVHFPLSNKLFIDLYKSVFSKGKRFRETY